VAIMPDGQAYAPLPGFTVFDVVQACHAENGPVMA
jgi:hypothetical protein